MITTIQLTEETKKALERAKEKGTETYEEVIKTLLQQVEKQKREQEQLMIEGCKEMAEESLRITREWETTDSTLNWEW